MRVFYDLSEIRGQIPNAAVTVGSFDGVHAGHREILRILNHYAQEKNGESVVVTFAPHPRHVIFPQDDSLKLLNSLEEKIYLLEQAGVDNLFVVRFDEEFRQLSSEAFARNYFFEGIGAKSIVMGYNHHFGHDRKGKETLEALQPEYGFDIFQLPKQLVVNHKVSSTVVRSLIEAGDLKTAGQLLTVPYFFITEVEADGILAYGEPYKLFPPDGVYAVTADNGASVSKTNLTIDSGSLRLSDSRYRSGEKLLIRFDA